MSMIPLLFLVELRPRSLPLVGFQLRPNVGERRVVTSYLGFPCAAAVGGPIVISFGPFANFNQLFISVSA